MVLGRERQVLILQMEALHTEALEAERDLETQYHRHQHELHSLREESLQVRPLPALPLFEPTLPILPICASVIPFTTILSSDSPIPYQVFRVFRQVSEEQRRVSEGRYRTLLLEAIQDAVYLSSQNQQLQADNKQLRKGELHTWIKLV